jgi:hypothetical protein
VHLFNGFLILIIIRFLDSLYIFVIKPLPDMLVARIFSHYICCLLSLLTVFFAVQKLCCLMQSHLSNFSLNC